MSSQTLTPSETLAIPHFLQQAAMVATLADFEHLIKEELPALFPYGILICGMGYITAENTIHTFRLLNFGFPMEYLHAIRTPDGGISSPVMQNWIKVGKPQIYSEADVNAGLPEEWRERYKRFNLGNLAAHGLIDRRTRQTSYFNFCAMPFELSDHHAFLLEILTPSLHAALLQVIEEAAPLGIEPNATAPELTEREFDLLNQLAAGHDQIEIADILGISEHTVRNHLRSLYMKLGVNKATQALEKAKRLHLLNGL